MSFKNFMYIQESFLYPEESVIESNKTMFHLLINKESKFFWKKIFIIIVLHEKAANWCWLPL